MQNDHPPERDDNPEYRAAVKAAATAIHYHTGCPETVLDVGSNIGQWSRAFAELGCEVTALDSPYMELHLLEPKPRFFGVDLSDGFIPCMGYDLTLCLEVAEHLPESIADQLVGGLVMAGRRVVFSAATPGQGGWKHINEQPQEYWDTKFRAWGCAVDVSIREHLPAGLPAYYRNNLVVYTSYGAEAFK